MRVKVSPSCPSLWDPMVYTVPGILQARILEWVAFPPPGDLPNPGIKARSPALHVDSLPAEPQGKPKNTGVCSLSLLQGIFPTQESNPGLLHCRQILYQLSYQGSLQHVKVEGTQEFSLLYPFTSASCWWGSTHLKEQLQADGHALCDQDSCSGPGGL